VPPFQSLEFRELLRHKPSLLQMAYDFRPDI
jgi:hypothetical protein